jgi:hypothetical protein
METVMVQIEVTQADIAKGVRASACECPVALAMDRATGRSCTVGVSCGHVDDVSVEFPPEVSDFVLKFDSREPVAPFTFELSLPAEAVRKE